MNVAEAAVLSDLNKVHARYVGPDHHIGRLPSWIYRSGCVFQEFSAYACCSHFWTSESTPRRHADLDAHGLVNLGRLQRSRQCPR